MKEIIVAPFVAEAAISFTNPWILGSIVALGALPVALFLINKFEKRVNPGRKRRDQEMRAVMRDIRDHTHDSPFDFGTSRHHVKTHGIYTRKRDEV